MQLAPWKRTNESAASRQPGFTLVELMVVIGVVAILAGLLLPSVSRAAHSTRRIACLSNLRQMDLAFRSYLADHGDRFPDRRDLKLSLGYRPWTDWPKSDPRGGWAAVVLAPNLPDARVWLCPSARRTPVGVAAQSVQIFNVAGMTNVVSYWLWRFDRPDDPIPLDNFWGKSPERAWEELRQATNGPGNPPTSMADVEFINDPYFPKTALALPEAMRGRAMHPGGRNAVMLDGRAVFVRDPRLR